VDIIRAVKQPSSASWLGILIAILFALSFWGPYVHVLGGGTNLAPLYAFAVGILIHFKGARIAARLCPKWATAVALASIFVFCACGLKKQTAPILAVECLSAATLVILIVYHPAVALFKPLDFKIARFYGRISYSFYLLHTLGVWAAFRIARSLDPLSLPAIAGALLITALAIACTTPLAYLSWRFVELPFLSLGKSGRSTESKHPHDVVADDGRLNEPEGRAGTTQRS
jgi:peptidoglycan/LPS O-acetylase OafA/YrhL